MYVGVGESQGIVGGQGQSRGDSVGKSTWATRTVGAAVIVGVTA